MKRLLLSLTALVLVPAGLSGCGAASDNVAATVNGHDISAAAVASFAKSPYVARVASESKIPLVSNIAGSVGSAKQRLALSTLVETQVLRGAVKAAGGKVTAEDEAKAEEEISGYEAQVAQQASQDQSNGGSGVAPTLSSSDRKVMLAWRAADAAYMRMAALPESRISPSRREVAEYFAAHRSEIGSLTCVDGFAVDPSVAQDAAAALVRGDSLDEVVADPNLQVRPVSASGTELCVTGLSLGGDSQIRSLFEKAPLKKWVSVQTSINGAEVQLFIFPKSRVAADLKSKKVREEITSIMNNSRASAYAKAVVDIDSRYGTWKPSDAAGPILPPLVPAAAARTATSLPAVVAAQ